MKKLLFLLLTLTLTGCATFQVSTLNHDPIYSIEGSDAEIVVINNEFELQRLLRTDFNFRLDFAQYALSQPRSFDWNNRILGNRYNRYNPYYRFGYSTYWNRDQMWNDWAWGYTSWNSWSSPHRWSPFGYDRWGYNNWTNNIHYGYGWNNYYGWNNNGWNYWNYYPNYNRRGSTAYINGRRSSNINTSSRRVNQRTAPTQTVKVKKRRINNSRNDKTINNNPRGFVRPESSNNGRRSRVRQNIPTQPVRTRQPRTIQPGQIRGGQRPSVLQQTRTSSQPSSQRRSSSSRKKN